MDPTDLLDVSSEEFAPYFPGSFVYCNPSEVETWTQSVPFGDFSLPSPPETSSDCESCDSQDMSSQTWSQASQSEEWNPVYVQDYSTYQQPAASGWGDSCLPVTAQHVQSIDNAAWLNAPSGFVDQGLSPVLSQESQSTHTLTSFSEPDCVLPPGLDLSFATEPSWYASGPAVYSGLTPSEPGVMPAQPFVGKQSDRAPLPQGYFPAARPSMMHAPNGLLPSAKRASCPALAPKKHLLPRTEGSASAMPANHGPHRTLRPQIQGQQQLHASVSNASGHTLVGPQNTVAHAGAPTAPAVSGLQTPPGDHGLCPGPMFSQPSATLQASAPAPCMVDPTAQDFSDFIHFDQEDHATPQAHLSLYQGIDAPSAYVPSDSKDMALPPQDANAIGLGAIAVTSNVASESDEGRHRSHPLYAAEPKEDGLFHCPYKATDPNCPHKPTKLKCNYDKYIDSHLKPFRCKHENCAKQEFSSTACLLRHEREAHGMHGHGERPHLCYYAGCERGVPGNGFPRRYNLFDHMKRVHDHKEDPRAGTRSPSMANSQDRKASAGRKRKASEPASSESAAQRQKTMPSSASQVQAFAPAPAYVFPPQDYFQQPLYAVPTARVGPAQSQVHHHWHNQRNLIERQMGSVQSPDDEAGLQRLTQNVEEFRRMSEVARRG